MSLARTSVFVALLGITVCVGAPSLSAQAPTAAPAARPVPPKSPDIHPDRTVTFRLLAPNANEVTLNGSWDGATNIKMTKDAGRLVVDDRRTACRTIVGLLVSRRRGQSARSGKRRDAA